MFISRKFSADAGAALGSLTQGGGAWRRSPFPKDGILKAGVLAGSEEPAMGMGESRWSLAGATELLRDSLQLERVQQLSQCFWHLSRQAETVIT